MQKNYQREKYDRKYIENKYGYICYNAYTDNSVFIHELHVEKEYRKKGKGSELEGELIKKEQPEVIYCDIDLTSNSPETALLAVLSVGYKITGSNSRSIICRKEIEWTR